MKRGLPRGPSLRLGNTEAAVFRYSIMLCRLLYSFSRTGEERKCIIQRVLSSLGGARENCFISHAARNLHDLRIRLGTHSLSGRRRNDANSSFKRKCLRECLFYFFFFFGGVKDVSPKACTLTLILMSTITNSWETAVRIRENKKTRIKRKQKTHLKSIHFLRNKASIFKFSWTFADCQMQVRLQTEDLIWLGIQS